MGYSRVKVYRRPRVALLATGDELVAPDQQPGPGQIRNVNEYSTAALVRRYGGVPLLLGIARDRTEEVAAKLEEAIGQGADLIVASAGVSVGAYDVVKDAVQAHGSIDLWKVRMRPGKPIAFGCLSASAFLRAARQSGIGDDDVRAVCPAGAADHGRLHTVEETDGDRNVLEPIESDGRETYARAWVERRDGNWTARLSGGQGSNMLQQPGACECAGDRARRCDASRRGRGRAGANAGLARRNRRRCNLARTRLFVIIASNSA